MRHAMHKRGLCRHAVSVRPSVCPSVRYVRVFVKIKSHIFKKFSPSGEVRLTVDHAVVYDS